MYCRSKSTFFYKIYFSTQFFFQLAMYANISKQANRNAAIELDEQIDIAVLTLLTTCV